MDGATSGKRCVSDESDLAPPKRLKQEKEKATEGQDLADDIHRTGARCVSHSSIQDSKASGAAYHVTGPVRTKPGRGNPTISMSCSDKVTSQLTKKPTTKSV